MFEEEPKSSSSSLRDVSHLPLPAFSPMTTKDMGNDAVQKGKGISSASKSTTQTTSSIPPIPIEKMNELLETCETVHFSWRVSSVTGILQEIMLVDVKEQEPRQEYPSDVFLSYKVFAPCCVHEEGLPRCRGKTDCEHCQCGCDQYCGDCSQPVPRGWAASHNVIEVVKNTLTGATPAVVKKMDAIDGKQPSDVGNIASIRERFLLPILTLLVVSSVEACVLEARCKYKEMYPTWNGTDPIPGCFAADGRWSKVYVSSFYFLFFTFY